MSEENPTQPQTPNMVAMVIPVPLYTQLVELVGDNVEYRKAAPIMAQLQQLKPQEIRQA